jgi:PAS domain-containing protein
MKGTIPGTTIQSHVEDNLQSELVVLRQRIQELEAEAGERNRVEQGMERAAREWRTTFDAIADMVSIHNENFRILRVNKAFASYFGLKPKEVLGKTCHELMHGDRVPCKGAHTSRRCRLVNPRTPSLITRILECTPRPPVRRYSMTRAE